MASQQETVYGNMTSSISSLDTSALGVGNSGMDYFDIWTSIRPLDQHFAILLCTTLEIDWKVFLKGLTFFKRIIHWRVENMYRIINLSFIKIQYWIKVALQPKINKCNFWHFNLLLFGYVSLHITDLVETYPVNYVGIYIPQNELMYF